MISTLTASRRWLLAICVVAFAIRLALVLHAGERVLVDDETGYDNIALNVVGGHGYRVGYGDTPPHPTAARGPTYVFYVAAFYAVFGHHVVPPLVGHCLLDVLSCILAYYIALRLFRSARGALMAAALYALYPPFIFNATQLITETVTNATFLGALAAFLRFVDTRRTGDLLVSGLCVGLGTLIKPPMAPLGAVFALALGRTLGWGRAIRAGAITCVVTALVLSPWIIRNQLVFHEFIPGVTLVGYTFWGGTAPGNAMHTVGSMADPAVPDSVRAQVEQVHGELERSHWFMEQGMQVIKRDPGRYVILSFLKIPQLWLNVGFDEMPSTRSWIVAIVGVAAFALAIYALRVAQPVAFAAPLLLLLWIFWTLANMPAPVLIRYAMPVYAVLFCFSGPGIDALAKRLGRADGGATTERTTRMRGVS
ncbi:MAG TPA: glycosyltransferase family 39 protein [Candidatus Krumholzibacteria bacterium]